MCFVGAEEGTFFLLSKDILYLSAENFRLHLNFQSHLFKSFPYKKQQSHKSVIAVFGGPEEV